jgi:predicted AlkP superfamily pyrophosphatase or phosphodiesterase
MEYMDMVVEHVPVVAHDQVEVDDQVDRLDMVLVGNNTLVVVEDNHHKEDIPVAGGILDEMVEEDNPWVVVDMDMANYQVVVVDMDTLAEDMDSYL